METAAAQLRMPRPATIYAIAGVLGMSHLAGSLVARLPGYSQSGLSALEAEIGPLSGSALVIAAGTWVAAAIIEEGVFRGLLFHWIARFARPPVVIGSTALLFAAAHGDLYQGTVALLLGLLLGTIRQVHGLFVAIAAHALNNLAAALLIWAGWHSSLVSLVLATCIAGNAVASLRQEMRRLARPGGVDAAGVQTAPRLDE